MFGRILRLVRRETQTEEEEAQLGALRQERLAPSCPRSSALVSRWVRLGVARSLERRRRRSACKEEVGANVEENESYTFYENFRHYCYYEPTRHLLADYLDFCMDDDGPDGDWIPHYEREHYRQAHGRDPCW